MRNPGQFGSSKPPASKAEPGTLDCAAVEQLLAEYAEDRLPGAAGEGIRERLRAHAAGCAGCQEKLAQARRGREWLLVLKQDALIPPAGLVAKILAQTSLAGAPGTAEIPTAAEPTAAGLGNVSGTWEPEPQVTYVLPAYDREAVGAIPGEGDRRRPKEAKTSAAARADRSGSSAPAWQRNTVVVLRRTLVEPRLAMVAAMAFFSITLTLNLAGIRLTNLHPADLAPSNVRRAASRQYAEVNARMARYYENLRIVYEVEARVQQLRRAAETNPSPQPETRPRQRSSNSSGNAGGGDARHPREGMVTKHSVRAPAVPDPAPVRTGPRMNAAWHSPIGWMGMAAARAIGALLTQPEERRFAIPFSALACWQPLCSVWSSRRSLSAPERGFA